MILTKLKRTVLILHMVFAIFSFNSCVQNAKHNSKKNKEVNKKYQTIKELAKHRATQLFDVFNSDITESERDALKFIYAYMPLSDLAGYSGDFFLQHVKVTLKSRKEVEWGNKIPNDIFKHFVLPHRVNNENLDTARIVFYNELKTRVKGLSMYDAALEVNHWCHEKVEYRPADIRTSAPLATVKTAYGRCGEESTFTVAALRSVCIPARQVYAPRWAHSDDNHAWVEVWIDGEWKFLGACEPEPVLNFGWFNEAASRAMLIHARVFGKYHGSEEVNISTSQYDDINVVDRYAITFKQFVKIVDKDGNPAPNVKIEYQLYNYAEFYSLATKKSDKNGLSYLTTGLGELLIWASNNKNFGFKKVIIGQKDTVTIVLSNPEFADTHWELIPPAASNFVEVNISEEQRVDNKKRLQYEDSVRNNYVSAFISKDEFLKNNLDEELWKYIVLSRGNYQEIIDFINNNRDAELMKTMLNTVALKDLRDTRADILNDHLSQSLDFVNNYPFEIFRKYILNPRIANEMLLAYRETLSNGLDLIYNNDVSNIITWIKDSITIKNDAQSYSLPITPAGVYKLRVSDSKSRDLFFVAVCRTFGIPSRLELGTNTPQYYANKKWTDIYFDGAPKEYKKFNVSFKTKKESLKFTPQYYHHFTLARFENNCFKTLDFGEYVDIDKIEDFKLKVGFYRLITSNRLSSGKILVDLKYLKINKDTVIELDFPEANENIEVVGKLNREKITALISDYDKRAESLQKSSNIVVAIIESDKEPSKHILNDIQKIKKDFDKLNNTIVIIVEEINLSSTFRIEDYPYLPYRTKFIITKEKPEILLNIELYNKKDTKKPTIYISNVKGEIIYYSEGYQIGVGDDILKKL